MKKFKFLPPYKPGNKTTFPESKNASGVYIIQKNGKIVYIGFSKTNLYRTMYRHFQQWNHPKQEVVTYHKAVTNPKNTFLVRIILCTPKQAQRLEKYLIVRYKPADNPDKLLKYQPTKLEESQILAIAEQYESVSEDEFVPF